MAQDQTWDLWYPAAGAQGMNFARGLMEESNVLIVHSAPPTLRVEVRDQAGNLIASGDQLARTNDSPMSRLYREGSTVRREDAWLGDDDIGRPVILPGGEIGILTEWWHRDDQREWRWQVEFHNSR